MESILDVLNYLDIQFLFFISCCILILVNFIYFSSYYEGGVS